MSSGRERARRTKPRVGDVVQFSLADGTFAYGRVLKDSSVAFYAERSREPGRPPIGSPDVEFTVGVYNDVLRREDVPVVGNDPQVNDREDWPPASVIHDRDGTWRIYDLGQMRAALPGEPKPKETAAVWAFDHILDRLEGRGEKWMRRTDGFSAGATPSS